MRRAYIPREALTAVIRAGRVSAGRSAVGGVIGYAVEGLVSGGLKKAAAEQSPGVEIQFPPACCNCLAQGPRVRPVDTESIVNQSVAYTFRFAIPHCPDCVDTAKRKRPGMMGLLAVFLVASILVGIAAAITGGVMEREGLFSAAPLVGLGAGALIALIAAKARRPRAGQASAYQAVFVSGLDLEFSGKPKGAVLSFANDAYGDHFIAANRAIGVDLR